MLILRLLIIYFSGAVSAIHLSGLIEANPDFEASWHIFSIALVITLVFIYSVVLDKGEGE